MQPYFKSSVYFEANNNNAKNWTSYWFRIELDKRSC